MSRLSEIALYTEFTQKIQSLHPSPCDSDGLRVYRRNYRQGHAQALSKDYPITKEAIGEEGFYYIATHFLFECPPQSENMDDFGNHFPDFLSGREEFLDFPQVPWLARFEGWLQRRQPFAVVEQPSGTYALWESLREGDEREHRWDHDILEQVEWNEDATALRVLNL